MESQEETYAKKLVLLRIPPRDTPIYFVVAADIYPHNKSVDDGDEYFYNEHTCPTNWLRDVEMVIAGDSADPHGLAEWVASIPAGDLLDDNGHDHSGLTKLDALDREPYGPCRGGRGPTILARRVLALFDKEGALMFEQGETLPGLADEIDRVTADYIEKRMALQEEGLVALLAAYMAETGHRASDLTLVMQNTHRDGHIGVRAWFEPKERQQE